MALRNEAGATLLESAMVVPFFLLGLLCTFDFLFISYQQLSLQYVLSQTMRDMTIFSFDTSTLRARIQAKLQPLGVTIAAADSVTLCPVEGLGTSSCAPNTVTSGAERELMILQVEKRMTNLLLTQTVYPNFRITAEVLGRNEPS